MVRHDRRRGQSVDTPRISADLSFPVLWSVNGGPSRPGRLDLAPDHLVLSGGSRQSPRTHEIALDDLAEVRMGRSPNERIGGRTSVVLQLRDGRVVSVVGFAPLGSLHELTERLGELMTARRPQPEF